MIVNLKKFYDDNPASEFTYKGKTHVITGKKYCATSDDTLHSLQKLHQEGKINLYAPVETYSEQFEHVKDKRGGFVKAVPIPNTRKKDNLPPISEQWKRDFSKQRKRGSHV